MFVVLIAAVATGSYRQSAGPAEGASFQGVVRASEPSGHATLRVATYNIHGGRDAHGRYSLERTAGCLHALDLIALNEVHASLWSGGSNQAMTLGERVGHAWLFAPAERRWWERTGSASENVHRVPGQPPSSLSFPEFARIRTPMRADSRRSVDDGTGCTVWVSVLTWFD